MTLEEVIMELYRLAETKEWEGKKTDEALFSALEGMERIWELTKAGKRKTAMINANKNQSRSWC
jgi:hypothetical protein